MVWKVAVEADRVAVVTMLTSKANQINAAFLRDLNGALDRVDTIRPRVTGVVLTSEGGVFSAGLDLVNNFNEPSYTRTFIKQYEEAMCRVFTLPYVTVAALNGHTLAGGCVLALACDFRVAFDGKYGIGVDEVRNAVAFPKGTNEIVKYALQGLARREALLLGKFWTPQQALHLGVVDALAKSPAAAVAAACAMVTDFPAKARPAYVTNKQYLQRPFLDRMRGETYDAFVAGCYTPEAQAQFKAAVARMKGRRKGRRGAASEARASKFAVLPARDQADVTEAPLLRRDGVRYEVLQQRHVPGVVECLVEVWVDSNVIMQALKITRDDFRPLATKRVEDGAASGLCLVAVEEATEEVVAFFLWEDMASSAWDDSLDGISDKFAAQFAFMSQLDAAYRAHVGCPDGAPLPAGTHLHGIYGGTRGTNAGKNIITTLMKLSAQHATAEGFSFMVTEAVVIGSQYVSYKLGWRDVALKQYTNFVHNGTTPFSGVPVAARTPCAVLFQLDIRPRSKL